MLGLSNKGSRQIDNKMINEFGLPGLVLMEEAALGIFSCLDSLYSLDDKMIYIFVGKGNNGGDGLALARILFNKGHDVRIINIFDDGYTSEAKLHLNVAKKLGIPITKWNSELERPDIIIDAILGTGFSGELQGLIKEAVLWMNSVEAIKVAVDIPTGMNGDTGIGAGVFVNADITIALGYPKFAHLLDSMMGSVYLITLEFAKILENELEENDKIHYLTDKEAGKLFSPRKLDSHKGTFGKVGIFGGKREMLGASLLAGKAALRSGSGLVTLWVEAVDEILGLEPELMLEAWDNFLNKDLDVLVIGPGLGREMTMDIEDTLRKFKGNVLIDADGLYWLKNGWIKREWISGELVLTPHPKEMEMLIGAYEDRREAVTRAARQYRGTVILKGYRTLISDGHKVGVNLTGNPGMATAGSGDVLSGMIGAFLPLGLDVYDAVAAGVYLHGLSGDLAKIYYGEEGVIARDIIENIPSAIKRVKNSTTENKLVKKIF